MAAFIPTAAAVAGRLLPSRRPRLAAGAGRAAPACAASPPAAGLSRRAALAAAAAAAVAAAVPAGAAVAAAAAKKKPVFEKTDSGLRYTDIKKGSGAFPGVRCVAFGGD